MDNKILEYILNQNCANVCCVNTQNEPYCFTCFYVYNQEENLLYYKSSAGTKHINMLLQNPHVAGTIIPDKLNRLNIRGVQFEGVQLPVNHPLNQQAVSNYYRKNPVAMAKAGEIYTIQINCIKYTDSSLGFGKKIHWKREEEPAL